MRGDILLFTHGSINSKVDLENILSLVSLAFKLILCDGELVKEDVLISNLSGFHCGPNIDNKRLWQVSMATIRQLTRVMFFSPTCQTQTPRMCNSSSLPKWPWLGHYFRELLDFWKNFRFSVITWWHPGHHLVTTWAQVREKKHHSGQLPDCGHRNLS